jgi:hypothetical protein
MFLGCWCDHLSPAVLTRFGPDPCGPGPRQSIRFSISPERSITPRQFEPHPDAVGHVRRLMSPRWHWLAVRSYHSPRGVRRVIGRTTAALAKGPPRLRRRWDRRRPSPTGWPNSMG